MNSILKRKEIEDLVAAEPVQNQYQLPKYSAHAKSNTDEEMKSASEMVKNYEEDCLYVDERPASTWQLENLQVSSPHHFAKEIVGEFFEDNMSSKKGHCVIQKMHISDMESIENEQCMETAMSTWQNEKDTFSKRNIDCVKQTSMSLNSVDRGTGFHEVSYKHSGSTQFNVKGETKVDTVYTLPFPGPTEYLQKSPNPKMSRKNYKK